jgi:hypothetical protein
MATSMSTPRTFTVKGVLAGDDEVAEAIDSGLSVRFDISVSAEILSMVTSISQPPDMYSG